MAKAFAGGLYNEKSAPRMTKSFEFLPDFEAGNPQTFFDIEIGTPGAEGNPKGRVVMEMF
jgi:hypothetical protein